MGEISNKRQKEEKASSNYHRIVIKLGTNLVTGGRDSLNYEAMAELVGQVAQLNQQGLEVILVSSGAVAAGKRRLGIQKKLRDIPFKQVLASVGQAYLMQSYDQLFSRQGIITAQALLTKADFLNRSGYLNARNTLLALLKLKVVPIINENDVVAVDELEGISFGDNDNLSAMVANLVDADLLIILSDVAGLYTADPKRDANAKLIPRVEKIDAFIESLAKGSSEGEGVGGMSTKIEAAKLATASGTAVVLADGREPNVILRLINGEALGTFFPPTTSKLESRKRWMLGLPAKGKIFIDSGAKTALQKQNKSLLPAGITRIEGEFERGDIVTIVDSQGDKIACGISNYKSADVELIKGCRSDQILKLLGYEYGAEVVHRDNLVIL